MKNLMVFVFLLSSISLMAQEKENPGFKNVQFGFGMAVNLESLDKAVAEEAGVSSIGFTLIDFRGRLSLFKYVTMDLGFSVSQFKDKLPFEEAVVYTSGQLSGLPTTAKSEIVSGSFYYSLGGRVPLTKRLYLNANVGKRNYSASRTITECTNCSKTEIALEAGSYIRGGASLMTFEDNIIGEVDLNYTFYFDRAFLSTISLGFNIYY